MIMQQPAKYTDYQRILTQIEALLQKATAGGGFDALNQEEANELTQLSEWAEAYEDNIPLMPVKVPQSIPEMIEFKMYEKKMKQREMARLLEVPETRLSEVLRGKRRVSLAMAKSLHTKLMIDANFILEHA